MLDQKQWKTVSTLEVQCCIINFKLSSCPSFCRAFCHIRTLPCTSNDSVKRKIRASHGHRWCIEIILKKRLILILFRIQYSNRIFDHLSDWSRDNTNLLGICCCCYLNATTRIMMVSKDHLFLLRQLLNQYMIWKISDTIIAWIIERHPCAMDETKPVSM